MNEQLFPRPPRHKKQPRAQQLREQLVLAANEIIRLRRLARPLGSIIDDAMRDLPPPPKPPSCRVEYSSLFGPVMFDSIEEFEQWLLKPWWRRLLTTFAPEVHRGPGPVYRNPTSPPERDQ